MHIMEIVIIGKGPSIRNKIQTDDKKIYVSLNSSIRLIDGIVDYHFMNDFENLRKIGPMDLIRSKNIVIPSYPHINEFSNKDYPAEKFINLLPKSYNGKVHIYELFSAVEKGKYEFLDVTWSVAETAVLWFTKRGYKKFTFIGVGTGAGYSPLITWEKPASHQNNKWLNTNSTLLKKHLDNYGCKYEFK